MKVTKQIKVHTSIITYTLPAVNQFSISKPLATKANSTRRHQNNLIALRVQLLNLPLVFKRGTYSKFKIPFLSLKKSKTRTTIYRVKLKPAHRVPLIFQQQLFHLYQWLQQSQPWYKKRIKQTLAICIAGQNNYTQQTHKWNTKGLNRRYCFGREMREPWWWCASRLWWNLYKDLRSPFSDQWSVCVCLQLLRCVKWWVKKEKNRAAVSQ